MYLWRIVPVAPTNDSRWQDRPVWQEVVVRAESAAMARLTAETLDVDTDGPPQGDGSMSYKSGFEDDKLYRVDRLGDEEAEAEGGTVGRREVLRSVKLRDARPPQADART